jgi:hypothetical protein
MPQVPAAPDHPPRAARRPLLVPPEEQFWKRYSPHHEFPLSGATSASLHVLALGLLLLVGYLLIGNRSPSAPEMPQMDVVSEASGAPAANPGRQPGGPAKAGNDEEVGPERKDRPEKQGQPVPAPRLNVPAAPRPPKAELPRGDGQRRLAPRDVPAELDELGRQAYQGLTGKTNRPGQGPGGNGEPGSGAADKGPGPGKGDGGPPGPGKLEQERRAQRQLRWHLRFTTSNGAEYQDQLHALGAVLVIPEYQLGRDGRPLRDAAGNVLLTYRKVIRDLSKSPAPVRFEDVRKIKGIFWIDDKPESVAALAKSLGLRDRPPLIAAFFPRAVEENLRALEKAKYDGPESRIDETTFRVVQRARGKYRGAKVRYDLVCEHVGLQPR